MYIEELITRLPFEANGYRFISCISRGSSSIVFAAINLENGYKYAVRVLIVNINGENYENKLFKRLLSLMDLLHPNIIPIYDAFIDDNILFLVSEFCNRGKFESVIKGEAKLTEYQVLLIMKQMLSALDYCHSQDITHGDIRPSKLLISSAGLVKLGGFKIEEKGNTYKTSLFDSNYFKAPEIIKGMVYDPKKSDIWSLGVTFFFIVTGQYPWGCDSEEVENNILNCNYNFPLNTQQSFTNIIRKMLVINPEKRATAKELLESSAFIPVISRMNKPWRKYCQNSIPMNICAKRMITSSVSIKKKPLIVQPKFKLLHNNSYKNSFLGESQITCLF